MDNKLARACLAELIGTFALVFVGGGVVCVAALTSEPRLDATAIALAEGLTLAVALTATHRASGGGLNPALSLMLYVFRRLDLRKTDRLRRGATARRLSGGAVSAHPFPGAGRHRPFPGHAARAGVSGPGDRHAERHLQRHRRRDVFHLFSRLRLLRHDARPPQSAVGRPDRRAGADGGGAVRMPADRRRRQPGPLVRPRRLGNDAGADRSTRGAITPFTGSGRSSAPCWAASCTCSSCDRRKRTPGPEKR